MERMSAALKEQTLEVLKAEVRSYALVFIPLMNALSVRLHHLEGCGIHLYSVMMIYRVILDSLSRLSPQEMVEPLEETRGELIFATEPLLSSLHLSIPGSIQYMPLVELDEVEVSWSGIVI